MKMINWNKERNEQAHRAYENCPEQLSPTKYNMFGLYESDYQFIKKGDLVFTSLQLGFKKPFPETDLSHWIGYVVQIRKGVGEFGSDQWFLRHPDGSLIRHENQSFKKINPSDEDLIRSWFDKEQLDEDMSNEVYTINRENEKSGFIIQRGK